MTDQTNKWPRLQSAHKYWFMFNISVLELFWCILAIIYISDIGNSMVAFTLFTSHILILIY